MILYIRRLSRVRWHYILWSVAASLPLIADSLMSYSGTAEEISFSSIAPYALHILLAGIWFGALPAFLFIIYDSLRASDKAYSQLNAAFLKKSSATTLPVMLLIIATGLIAADCMVTTLLARIGCQFLWLAVEFQADRISLNIA